MKITNRLNLHQSIVSAIEHDPYDSGGADISVTGLIQPPLMAQLRREHEDEIERDASEMIWMLLGSCAHVLLERAAQKALHGHVGGEHYVAGDID